MPFFGTVYGDKEDKRINILASDIPQHFPAYGILFFVDYI